MEGWISWTSFQRANKETNLELIGKKKNKFEANLVEKEQTKKLILIEFKFGLKKNKFEAKLVEKEQTKKPILNWNGKKETQFEVSNLGVI